MSKTLELNNGRTIPIVGLGTYQSKVGEVLQAVKDAIDAGYRHIDCAWFYENEEEIGRAIKEKIAEGVVIREDLFITSKLWNNFHGKEKVLSMIRKTLSDLQLDYLDLYLIHWPIGFKENVDKIPPSGPDSYTTIDHLDTWAGMEECVNLGLAKSIGLSNFNSVQIDNILNKCKIKPACNQVEVNTNINQKKLIKFCKERGIVVVGYCPLGQPSSIGKPGFPQPGVLDPKIKAIGEKYNKTAAQVILNYLVSLGISVIPKSTTKHRILENIDIFDFTLSKEDVEYLDSLNTNERVAPFKSYIDHPDYSFHLEY